MPTRRRAASPAPSARSTKSDSARSSNNQSLSLVRDSLKSLQLLNLYDPTFLFLVNTFWSVLFIEADDTKKTLQPTLPSLKEIVWTVLDPAVAIGLIEFGAFLYFARSGINAKPSLTKSESLTMHWRTLRPRQFEPQSLPLLVCLSSRYDFPPSGLAPIHVRP